MNENNAAFVKRITEKVNNILFTLLVSFSGAQNVIIAVSNANRQIVNKYCQKDSKRLIFAIVCDVKIEVYNGKSIKDIDLDATLLIP